MEGSGSGIVVIVVDVPKVTSLLLLYIFPHPHKTRGEAAKPCVASNSAVKVWATCSAKRQVKCNWKMSGKSKVSWTLTVGSCNPFHTPALRWIFQLGSSGVTILCISLSLFWFRVMTPNYYDIRFQFVFLPFFFFFAVLFLFVLSILSNHRALVLRFSHPRSPHYHRYTLCILYQRQLLVVCLTQSTARLIGRLWLPWGRCRASNYIYCSCYDP